MAQILCASHLKLCAIRATRLLDDCTFATGPENTVTTKAGIRFAVDPEIEEGEELIQKNGCGEVCLSIKDPDQVKRANAELELCTYDMDLLNILNCSEPLLDAAGDTIGGCARTGVIDCPGAFVEIWVRVGRSTGDCGDAETGQYNFVRYVYPRVKFGQATSRTFEDGLNNLILTGTIEANPNGLDGPFSDLPQALDDTIYECWFYEEELPDLSDCGYGPVPVPADANDI